MKIAAFVLAFLVIFSLPVSAQVAGGALTGTVTNDSGAPVPDASISVKEVTTGLTRGATTNGALQRARRLTRKL